jgi:hypothetical protein
MRMINSSIQCCIICTTEKCLTATECVSPVSDIPCSYNSVGLDICCLLGCDM